MSSNVFLHFVDEIVYEMNDNIPGIGPDPALVQIMPFDVAGYSEIEVLRIAEDRSEVIMPSSRPLEIMARTIR